MFNDEVTKEWKNEKKERAWKSNLGENVRWLWWKMAFFWMSIHHFSSCNAFKINRTKRRKEERSLWKSRLSSANALISLFLSHIVVVFVHFSLLNLFLYCIFKSVSKNGNLYGATNLRCKNQSEPCLAIADFMELKKGGTQHGEKKMHRLKPFSKLKWFKQLQTRNEEYLYRKKNCPWSNRNKPKLNLWHYILSVFFFISFVCYSKIYFAPV